MARDLWRKGRAVLQRDRTYSFPDDCRRNLKTPRSGVFTLSEKLARSQIPFFTAGQPCSGLSARCGAVPGPATVVSPDASCADGSLVSRAPALPSFFAAFAALLAALFLRNFDHGVVIRRLGHGRTPGCTPRSSARRRSRDRCCRKRQQCKHRNKHLHMQPLRSENRAATTAVGTNRLRSRPEPPRGADHDSIADPAYTRFRRSASAGRQFRTA